MNFSDIITFSDKAKFSNNSQFLAIVKGMRLSVYESSRMALVTSWTILDHVSDLEWSLDSTLLICAQAKRGLVQVLNIKDLKWECKVSMGPSGLSGAWLSPDGRHIITVCKYKIRLNIWSLLQKEVFSIQSPKYSRKGVIFSKCGQFTGVLLFISGQDWLQIFNKSFKIVSNFQLKTENTSEIIWSNDNFYIFAHDPEHFLVYDPSGNLLHELSPSPKIFTGFFSGNIGSNLVLSISNNKLWVIHSTTWIQYLEIKPSAELRSKDVMIYKEEEVLKDGVVSCSYEITEEFKVNPLNDERSVTFVKWSHDEKYLAVRFDSMPQVVFIWDTVLMTLKSVLVHMKSVKTVEWCPVRNICLIGTASGRVYIWSEDGALLCDLPFGNGYLEKMFKVESVEWSLDGQYFLAKDRLELVVAYPNLDEICQ